MVLYFQDDGDGDVGYRIVSAGDKYELGKIIDMTSFNGGVAWVVNYEDKDSGSLCSVMVHGEKLTIV